SKRDWSSDVCSSDLADQPRAVGKDPLAAAGNDVGRRALARENRADLVKGAGQELVVGAQPAEDFAARAGQALVDRIGLAVVGLRSEEHTSELQSRFD